MGSERSMSHATRSRDCREECCERGYYHLHRQLNHPFLRHKLRIIARGQALGSAASLVDERCVNAVYIVGNDIPVDTKRSL